MSNASSMSEDDGRCPNCGEDELDGARCYYCGWHDYNCGLCDECLALATPTSETDQLGGVGV